MVTNFDFHGATMFSHITAEMIQRFFSTAADVNLHSCSQCQTNRQTFQLNILTW